MRGPRRFRGIRVIEKPPHGANPPQDSWIDFSSNLHPAPPPEPILSAARLAVERSVRYPGESFRTLRRDFAEALNLSEERILFGGGSSALLYQIFFALKPKHVLIPIPCFSEYPYLAARCGAALLEHPTRFGDLGRPPKFQRGTCVILSNPCNPTGKIYSAEVMREWMAEARRAEGVLIVDEAYADFKDTGPDLYSADQLDSFPLIVLRSPLKFFSLPGLRSGLAILSEELARRVEAELPPWPMSQPAIEATRATLHLDSNEIHSRRRRIRAWSDTFQKSLQTVTAISVTPSDVHYFLIRLPAQGPNGKALADQLAREQMWIRTHDGIPGLTADEIRISTRFPEENGKLIGALKQIFSPVQAGAAGGHQGGSA